MTSLRAQVVLLAAALAGCSTMQIRTEYDPNASYKAYRTYSWNPVQPGAEQAPPMRNPGVYSYVVSVIERGMASKGLVRTTAEANPDLFVAVHGWSRTGVDVVNYGYTYAPAYAYGGPFGPTAAVAVPVAQVREYTEGTLLVDFIDAKSKKVVWRGTATDTVANEQSVRAAIDEAIQKLLAAYPPK